MRFSLELPYAGHFFFDTLPDMTNALAVANAFKPFENNVEFKATAFEGDDCIDLAVTGIKFTDYISWGLDDESRRAYDKFEMEHRTVTV